MSSKGFLSWTFSCSGHPHQLRGEHWREVRPSFDQENNQQLDFATWKSFPRNRTHSHEIETCSSASVKFISGVNKGLDLSYLLAIKKVILMSIWSIATCRLSTYKPPSEFDSCTTKDKTKAEGCKCVDSISAKYIEIIMVTATIVLIYLNCVDHLCRDVTFPIKSWLLSS